MLAAGGYHDLGGQSDSTPLVFSAPPYEHWELQVSGMVSLLVRTGRLTIYELRRGIEGLPPAVAASATYYEKWTLSTITMLLERGIISTAEWDEAIGRPLAAPPLSVGDHVVVRSEDAANRFRKPHIRTPGYIFGCAGEVIACMGSFEDPELAAFRENDCMQELYRVKFHQSDVWRNAGLAYEGSDLDTIVVDITRPWLLEKPTSWSPSFPASVIVPSAGCAPHHHHDDESDGEHEHAGGSPGLAPSGSTHSRAEVEQVAIDREGAEPRFKPWAECLLQLLFRKSILTPEDVHKAAASQASVLAEARGPAIIAKAWVDAAFKSRLLANAQVAVKELGIDATNPAAPTVLQALENTDSVHNLIVCTLCSCYPQAILGMSPQWYRSRSYRARCVREPRAVLAEFGTVLAPDVEVRVHDSTSELRFIVIPQRPRGTDGWTEEQLRPLVTRDSMLGVSFALPAAL